LKQIIDKSTFIVPPSSTGEWRKARVYQNIVGVSNGDLISGSNYIEKLQYPPWDSRNDLKKGEKIKDEKIGYGKYSNDTYAEVKEKNPSYFTYMCENVPRFRLKAAQLGLED